MADHEATSAVALLLDAEGVCLERRPQEGPPKLRCPNRIGFFGGGRKPGESTDETVLREIDEEMVVPVGTSFELHRIGGPYPWLAYPPVDRVDAYLVRTPGAILTAGTGHAALHLSLEAPTVGAALATTGHDIDDLTTFTRAVLAPFWQLRFTPEEATGSIEAALRSHEMARRALAVTVTK